MVSVKCVIAQNYLQYVHNTQHIIMQIKMLTHAFVLNMEMSTGRGTSNSQNTHNDIPSLQNVFPMGYALLQWVLLKSSMDEFHPFQSVLHYSLYFLITIEVLSKTLVEYI